MTALEIRETREAIYVMCKVTLRSVILLMIVGFGLVLMAVTANAATLKSISTVNDDVIRVGDVFEDAGEHVGAVVGRAPAPGADMTLNARTLTRIATAYNLDWKAQSLTDQSLIKREAHTVSALDIEDAVKVALVKRGVEGNYGIVLSNVTSTLVLPGNVPATAEVSNLVYTPGRNVFVATIAAPSADNPVKTMNVSGTIQKTVQVPVMKGTFKKGDIIGSTDLEWIDVAQNTLLPDSILDADSLIGKTPVRFLAVGQPLRAKDVENPQLVARGDDVTIIFNLGGMQLTAKGKAMQNGAEGDLIRTVNVTSNRSMNAKVTGDRVVTVD